MGFILYIIAYLLVAIFTPIGIVYSHIKGRGNLKDMAIALDEFGNVAMKELFNDILGNGFGGDETISSVLGKNELNGTLKPLGRLLNGVLNLLDKDHSVKSIKK